MNIARRRAIIKKVNRDYDKEMYIMQKRLKMLKQTGEYDGDVLMQLIKKYTDDEGEYQKIFNMMNK